MDCRSRLNGRMTPCPACVLGTGLLLALLGVSAPAQDKATTVYEHVDAQGNVTFSSEPMKAGPGEKLETIKIQPSVSEAERAAAEERLRELQRAAASLGEPEVGAGAGETDSVDQAQEDLRRAREALEEAKEKTVDDWQYLVRGGRVLKQSYLDRVEAAEQKVEAAQEALRQARRDAP